MQSLYHQQPECLLPGHGSYMRSLMVEEAYFKSEAGTLNAFEKDMILYGSQPKLLLPNWG